TAVATIAGNAKALGRFMSIPLPPFSLTDQRLERYQARKVTECLRGLVILVTTALFCLGSLGVHAAPTEAHQQMPGVHYLQLPRDTTDTSTPAVFGRNVGFARGVSHGFSIERMDMGTLGHWRPWDVFAERQNVPPQLN